MKFKLEIECDNAAFGDGMSHTCAEVSRILKETADGLLHECHEESALRDLNGNTVGKYWFEGERDV